MYCLATCLIVVIIAKVLSISTETLKNAVFLVFLTSKMAFYKETLWTKNNSGVFVSTVDAA